ncbi:hypothetical protein LSAT2_006025 [Lamellibrachia satsuma]|nr:hypothetical protein LSAT2_006025 [Lamellibrachia satsuma]
MADAITENRTRDLWCGVRRIKRDAVSSGTEISANGGVRVILHGTSSIDDQVCRCQATDVTPQPSMRDEPPLSPTDRVERLKAMHSRRRE